MKNVRMTLYFTTAALLLGVTASGCSTTLPAPKPEPAFRSDPDSTSSNTAVKPSAHGPADSKLVSQVEKKIRKTRGEQVTLSKKLLKQLLEEHRSSELQTARLSAQLEALKKIDRDSTATTTMVRAQ